MRSPAPRFLFREERVEAMLHCRDVLHEALQLPIPSAQGDGAQLAAEVSELSVDSLNQLERQILASEWADGGKALAGFLADWEPMTTFLSVNSPGLRAAHGSIDRYRDTLSECIDAHKDGNSTSATPCPPLNSAEYLARMNQAGNEVIALRHAANLAAVRGKYFSASGGVESELQRATAMSTQKAAAPFVAKLRHAVARGPLNPGWVHPLYRWNHQHVAAAAGDVDLARALVDASVRPHLADATGMTPLHVAAAGGSSKLVAVFLAQNADPNAQVLRGYRPLHFAARAGDRRTIETLLHGKAEIDAQDPTFNKTALHFAATEGKLGAVRALIAAGANPLLKTKDGSSVRKALMESQAARSAPDYKLTRLALEEAERIAKTELLRAPAGGEPSVKTP
jgi:hypothetical protein